MELLHQTTPESGPALVLQGEGGGLPTVMPLADPVAELRGRFADFSLVRPFVRALLANKPESLTLDYLCDASADLVRFALALNIRVTVEAGLDGVAVGDEPVDQRWGNALLAVLQGLDTDASTAAWSDAESGYEQYALS